VKYPIFKKTPFFEEDLSAEDKGKLKILREELRLGDESYKKYGASSLDIEKIKAEGRKRVSSTTS